MTKPTVVVVCNALDDVTRSRRGISTDSPAASRKVIMLCQALRKAGTRAYVLSAGRGKAGGKLDYFPTSVRRVQGVPVVYVPFCTLRGVSEMTSGFALAWGAVRLARHTPGAFVFYNRMPLYLPALLIAALGSSRNLLDLEDGEVLEVGRSSVKSAMFGAAVWLFDHLCRGGALLACRALRNSTRVRPVQCYYGTADKSVLSAAALAGARITVLMSGTLTPGTGAPLLLEAIRMIRRLAPDWAAQLRFEVCGSGSSSGDFDELAQSRALPEVVVHGRTTDAQYRGILRRCDVGLALKPADGPLANTTFPSKVIEFASAGLLVLTTDISDVREVLGHGALYLERSEPQALVGLLAQCVQDRRTAIAIAEAGHKAVWSRCSPEIAGRAAADFIFGNSA